MYKRILVTLDGSEASEAILGEVVRFAEGSGMTVTLCRVAEVPQPTDETPEPARVPASFAPGKITELEGQKVYENRGQALARVRDDTEHYLRDRSTCLTEAGIDTDVKAGFGDPATAIVDMAGDVGADLIMMATHGRTGLAQVAFGSVAGKVMGTGKKPVLMIRPPRLK